MSQPPAASQGPIAESRYNRNYFCNILGVERVGENKVDINFEVFGDGSLGPLQVLPHPLHMRERTQHSQQLHS